MRELEQGMGLQAGAVCIVKTQMQKARYAENVLRLGRHLMADVSATSAPLHLLTMHAHLWFTIPQLHRGCYCNRECPANSQRAS